MARILLVDDRPENLLALEAILSTVDHELVRASSGDEALKALLTEDFAVILLDVSMPGMDGLETAAHIKRRERTRDVPIIFLTAVHPDAEHAFRGYSAGAVDYVSKPFDPWVLRAKVAVFVDLYCKRQQLQEQAALLRSRLDGQLDGGPAHADIAAELARRLATVESAFAKLRPAVADPAVDDVAVGLTRLRAVVDALDAR
jgi:CheY-like chemotaxis protein